MGIGCCGPAVAPSLTLSNFATYDTQRKWRFVEPYPTSENCSKEGDSLSATIRKIMSDGTPCETSHEGVQQATTIKSTNTPALISRYSEDQRLNESNSPHSHRENKFEQDNEDKKENSLRRVTAQEGNAIDMELKVSRFDKSNNYRENLSRSISVLAVVEPDNNYDDEQFSDIVIVGVTDAIIENLKTENVHKEKMIQELLMENEKLKKSFPCGQRQVRRRSVKFREKINEIRKRSNTLPSSLSSLSLGKEMCYGDSGFDSTNTLPDIADQLLFRSSLHEAKKRREENRGLPELGEKSGSWQFSQFVLL